MKRVIILMLFYLTQFMLMVLFLVPGFNSFVEMNIPFLLYIWEFYKYILSLITKILHLDFLADISVRLSNMVSAVIINVNLSIIYLIITFIFSKIFAHIRKKKLAKNNLSRYTLSEEEKARFDYKLYIRKFSIKGAISYIIPVITVLFFIFVRFDKVICLNDKYSEGIFNIYNSQIKGFLYNVHPGFDGIVDGIAYNYIYFVDSVIEIVKFRSLEYLLIGTFIFIYFVSWSVIVFICARINRKHAAKRRAYRAKKKYINKMEKLELKAKLKSKNRISSKAQEIVGEDNNANGIFEDASSISIVSENADNFKYTNKQKEAEYIDDISTGVTDLGVASTGVEDDEPIERKIPIFIDDEEVDIVLDKEPFIEIEEELDDYEEDVMPFFEKYSPELADLSYINENLLETQLEVEDEEEIIQENIFVEVKQINDEEDKIFNNKKEESVNDHSEEEIIDTVEAIEEVTKQEVLKEKQDTVKDLKTKKENIKSKKKDIKPINIKNKFDEKDRFKNAKKKYYVLPNNDNSTDKMSEKKRNLLRRKYKK